MPVVTARLSQLFYERMGEQVTNELVNWFNAVDEAYRSDLRALNEANFARFDARLDKFAAEVNAKLDAKLDKVAAIEMFAELRGRIDHVSIDLNAKIDATRVDLERTIERVQKELAWRSNATLLGIVIAIVAAVFGS